jgi:phytoene dehydrogenase-like protein
MADSTPDAIVVGSGPNGLAAAVTLAQAGVSVQVLEAAEAVGGGMRSAGLTEPGFVHDVCSAIHPLVLGSPFLRRLPLDRHGLDLIHPPDPLAHPLDNGTAVVLERSVAATAASLGRDGAAYRRLFEPLVRDSDRLMGALLGPPRPRNAARAAVTLGRFGPRALRSAVGLARGRFEGRDARALFAGSAAHSMLPLEAPASASFGLVLNLLGHAVGWPLARGGSQRLADAMRDHLTALGGEVVTSHAVEALDELPPARAILLDVGPRQLLRLAGDRLPPRYRRALGRFRYGPGACKVDWALDGPIPWRAEGCARAATVHVGGTLEEIAASEHAVARGKHAERPFVLLAQQSLFDPTRAPEGKHTGWAYCHVPSGSGRDVSERVEAQVERFAPGFRDLVRARSVLPATELARRNPNFVGGDINGGLANLRQLIARPAPRLDPYSTPADGVYLCSASTPPGGGVHGMCGYFAARSALRREFGRSGVATSPQLE